ncbi:uncharacterized protein LOC113771643 [Coffea eugenioides]|uniref:uncharacterized protein LOC113771643 n=1 Tax=Coffea eugenioides TaxID=49369 RepID=UPI000F614324|nr:uncharacterized protein LOC113771643 [Coffea eugenioides]
MNLTMIFGITKNYFFHLCDLGRGPNYPVLLLPNDMKRLILKECVGRGIRCLSDVLKNIISLNDLSYLEISGLDGIEFLLQFSFAPTPCDQLEVSSFSPLRNLQALMLNNLPNLVGLFYRKIEACLLPLGIFSSLTKLWISYCHNMKQLFTIQLLQNLQNLEDLEIRNCEGLKQIATDDNGVGKGGKEGIQLTSSEATTTIILPKLRRLHLTWLPQLKNICTAAMICDSITEIEMFGCPKVEAAFVSSHHQRTTICSQYSSQNQGR